MTYSQAVDLLRSQEFRVKKVDGVRFVVGRYEYRLMYEGGFASFVRIDRREVGKRNFKYFGGVSAFRCWSADDVMNLVKEEIGGVV